MTPRRRYATLQSRRSREVGRYMAIWIGLGLVLVIVAVVAVNTIGRYTGVTVPSVPPKTLSALLAPHYRLTTPEAGEGPFPTVLLLSGCDGPRDNLDTWAAALAEAGWASLIVDSHTPRGFTEYELWRLVCAGQLLNGGERAGDVAVALADARAMPEVDETRLALLGASHGGWTVLEFLSMADYGQIPHTITEWPEGAAPLDGIVASILLYPYCGGLSRASQRGWKSRIPVLFLLAERDKIANERPCLALAMREERRGQPVETHVYAGVTHGFDAQEKAPLSTLGYFPDATADALARGTRFLNAAIGKE